MDYGGVRVSFFDDLINNFKNTFLSNSYKNSIISEYIKQKNIVDSYVQIEFTEEDNKLLEKKKELQEELNVLGKKEMDRKITQKERIALFQKSKLQMQLQNLKDSLPEHIVKYNEFKQAEMQLNKIKNKLENFTKALRNESCLHQVSLTWSILYI